MDFTNHYLGELFELFGIKFYLTETLLATWVVMAVLILLAVIVRIRLPKFKVVPAGFQNVVEIMVETMDNFTISTMGAEYRNFGGFFFGLFAFILFSNYSGLIGLRPPTADLAATAALSIIIFLAIQWVGLKSSIRKLSQKRSKPTMGSIGNGILYGLVDVISEVSGLLSFSFRLFGNMLGGLIIMGLIYSMFPPALRIGIPAVLHAYFDIFTGALQAFIFTILSMTSIQQKGSKN